MSLSRLNHRLPGREAYPKIMQGTAEFHYQIAYTLLPQTDPVFDDATAFDTALDMFDPKRLATEFFDWHKEVHLWECECQEAQILPQPAPGREGRGGRLSNPLIMDAAAVGVAQKEEREEGID